MLQWNCSGRASHRALRTALCAPSAATSRSYLQGVDGSVGNGCDYETQTQAHHDRPFITNEQTYLIARVLFAWPSTGSGPTVTRLFCKSRPGSGAEGWSEERVSDGCEWGQRVR